MKKKLVVLTGAGISAESGISTFRGADGLWEGHNIMDVASPTGWKKNPELVLEFYNQRRRQLHEVHPNPAHLALPALEDKYEVTVITQNVDNLHERAGSSRIIHLHGELLKARSTGNENLVYDWPGDIRIGDVCEAGHQLRPHIVWFGEMVPMMDVAVSETAQADIFLVIGTSLAVYPAAGLLDMIPRHCNAYLVDPFVPDTVQRYTHINLIAEAASTGVPALVNRLIQA